MLVFHARAWKGSETSSQEGICGETIFSSGSLLTSQKQHLTCQDCVNILTRPGADGWIFEGSGWRKREASPEKSLPGRHEKQLDAANRLEDLALSMKALVPQLREGMDAAAAYKKIYELRRELGRVVATLGEGVPR